MVTQGRSLNISKRFINAVKSRQMYVSRHYIFSEYFTSKMFFTQSAYFVYKPVTKGLKLTMKMVLDSDVV